MTRLVFLINFILLSLSASCQTPTFEAEFQKCRQLIDNQQQDIALDEVKLIFDKALDLKKQEQLVVADSIEAIAFVFYGLQNIRATRICFQKTLQLYENALKKPTKKMARLCNNIGVMLNYEEKTLESIQYLRRSAAIHYEVNDGKVNTYIAKGLNNIGMSYMDLGYYDRALECLDSALLIKLELEGKQSNTYLETHFNIGSVYTEMQYQEKAEDHLFETIELIKDVPDASPPLIFRTYNSLGANYANMGKYVEARHYHDLALKLKKEYYETIYHRDVANSINNIGAVLIKSEQFEAAKPFLNQALMVKDSLESPQSVSIGVTLLNLGNAYLGAEQLDSAELRLNTAKTIFQNNFITNKIFYAVACQSIGDLYEKKGEINKTVALFQEAVDLLKGNFQYQSAYVIEMLINLGLAHQKSGNYEKALALFEEAIIATGYQEGRTDFSQVHAKHWLLEALFFKSDLLLYHLSPTPTLSDLKTALNLLATARQLEKIQKNETQAEKTKFSLVELSHKIHENSIEAYQAYQKHDNEKIDHKLFEFFERSRATILLEATRKSYALQFAGVANSLVEKELELSKKISIVEKLIYEYSIDSSTEAKERIEELRSRLQPLTHEYQELLQQIEAESPKYHNLKFAQTYVDIPTIQQEYLAPDQGMIGYFVGRKNIHIYLVTPDNFKVTTIKKDFPLEEWVSQLQEAIRAPFDPLAEPESYPKYADLYTKLGHQLYQKLIEPIAQELPRRLIIIPDDVLANLPFEVLLSNPPTDRSFDFKDHDYLVRTKDIAYCYSATMFREMTDKEYEYQQIEQQPSVLAMAPFANFSDEAVDLYQIQRLAFSKKELEAVCNSIPCQSYMDQKATDTAYLREAKNYRIVHLSTHGVVQSKLGNFSYLLFYPDEARKEVKKLYVREIYTQPLKAEMVVLSACETGIGQLQRGEGTISLARAFAYSGAKSIVTTLWKVKENVSAQQMAKFYALLQASTKEGSNNKDYTLSEVKRNFIDDDLTSNSQAHPFNWAGFIAIGDMNPLSK